MVLFSFWSLFFRLGICPAKTFTASASSAGQSGFSLASLWFETGREETGMERRETGVEQCLQCVCSALQCVGSLRSFSACGGGLTLGSSICFRKGSFGASHTRLIQSAVRAFQGLLKAWVCAWSVYYPFSSKQQGWHIRNKAAVMTA